LVLLTFLLQSYATETHIHFLREVTAASAAGSSAMPDQKVQASKNQAHKKKNAPAPENPDTCPLCQLLYGGQYVAPQAIVFFLAMISVSTIETTLGVLPHYDAVSHNWRGRAPPRA
jgi:hypothetical protein